MNFMDVVKKRRAVREYTAEPVTRAEIEELIGAAIQAPSAINGQPWAFAVVLGREQIDGYGKRALQWLLANASQLRNRAIEEKLRQRVHQDPDFRLFYEAPALVLVLAKTSQSQAVEDCCLAAENLMLAARDHKLGSCWIGFARPWLNLPQSKAELGLPKECEVVAPVVLGHPVAWPESHGRNPAEIYWLSPVPSETLVETTV